MASFPLYIIILAIDSNSYWCSMVYTNKLMHCNNSAFVYMGMVTKHHDDEIPFEPFLHYWHSAQKTYLGLLLQIWINLNMGA